MKMLRDASRLVVARNNIFHTCYWCSKPLVFYSYRDEQIMWMCSHGDAHLHFSTDCCSQFFVMKDGKPRYSEEGWKKREEIAKQFADNTVNINGKIWIEWDEALVKENAVTNIDDVIVTPEDVDLGAHLALQSISCSAINRMGGWVGVILLGKNIVWESSKKREDDPVKGAGFDRAMIDAYKKLASSLVKVLE